MGLAGQSTFPLWLSTSVPYSFLKEAFPGAPIMHNRENRRWQSERKAAGEKTSKTKVGNEALLSGGFQRESTEGSSVSGGRVRINVFSCRFVLYKKKC